MGGVVVPTRPDWDDYFLAVAKVVSTRADCSRSRFGAVIVKDRRIVATGYNGSKPGGPSCLKGECPRGRRDYDEQATGGSYAECVALHAEQNAIAYGNRSDTQGATIYVVSVGKRSNALPCDMCDKLIAAAGIERVVTRAYGE